MSFPELKAVLFDVFGTVVDWRSGVIRELTVLGDRRGLNADWAGVADDWRAEYQPAMEEVRSGRRAWTILDMLHRESLVHVLSRHGIDLPDADLDAATMAWHRLDPWPDVIPGLLQLKSDYTIGTLSNGNTRLLTDIAARTGLPWDVILGAETAGVYKPRPEAYLRNVALLGLVPAEVMLVAAHNSDLAAAQTLGLRTAFLPRPTEHGPAQTHDLVPEGLWNVVTPDCRTLAIRLSIGAAQ